VPHDLYGRTFDWLSGFSVEDFNGELGTRCFVSKNPVSAGTARIDRKNRYDINRHIEFFLALVDG
jgi:hypothetical protein